METDAEKKEARVKRSKERREALEKLYRVGSGKRTMVGNRKLRVRTT